MRNSVLFKSQSALGASFTERRGWRIVSVYTDPAQEYLAAKTRCAVYDCSNLGQIELGGADRLDLLHRISTNEVRNLSPGEGQVNIFTNEKGRIIDRVMLLNCDSVTRIITSPANGDTILQWLDRFIFIEDVRATNLQKEWAALALYGPQSEALIHSLFPDLGAGSISNFCFRKVVWREMPIIVQRTAELAVPGFNLLIPTATITEFWDALLMNHGEVVPQPLGLEAFEALRIEAGWPAFGQDFDDQVNPHEAQMISYVSFEKGCYIGQEVIARLDTYDKVQKYLAGIEIESERVPQKGDTVSVAGNQIGEVTSAAYSFGLKHAIALALVKAKSIRQAAEVVVHSEAEDLTGRLVTLPFAERRP